MVLIRTDLARSSESLFFVVTIDEVEADEPFLRLDERTVRHVVTCRPRPHRSGCARSVEAGDRVQVFSSGRLGLERSMSGEGVLLVEVRYRDGWRRCSIDEEGVGHRRSR
jgi:hypothetical protein